MANDSLNNFFNLDNPTDILGDSNTVHEAPRIYVACLAAYNSGYLHGVWLDATQEVEDIHREIQQMLSKSPIPNAEEWAIHACEGFGTLRLEEHESIERVHEIAAFISEHGALGAELVSYYGHLGDAQYALDNDYQGAHDSELDFATQIFDDCYISDIPESIHCYMDYQAFSRDIFINDYFSVEADGKTHVFSHH